MVGGGEGPLRAGRRAAGLHAGSALIRRFGAQAIRFIPLSVVGCCLLHQQRERHGLSTGSGNAGGGLRWCSSRWPGSISSRRRSATWSRRRDARRRGGPQTASRRRYSARRLGWRRRCWPSSRCGTRSGTTMASPSRRTRPSRSRLEQVQGTAEAPPLAGGGGEAEQVGDRSRADQGGPVAADHGIVGGVPGVAVGRREAGADVGAGDGGGAEAGDLRRPRNRRGFQRDGRTGVSLEGPGGCGGHGA